MNFKLKTILGIALIASLLLLILIVSGLYFLRTSNQNQLAERAEANARLLAFISKDSVIANDLTTLASAGQDALIASNLATLRTIMQEFLSNPEIAYVRILGKHAMLAEDGDPELLARPFQRDERLTTVGDDIFDTSAPIQENGYLFGHVELGLATAPIELMMNTLARKTTMIAVIEVTLLVFFSLALGSLLTRQLQRLKKAAEQVAENGPGLQIEIFGNDEMADVSRAFNHMSSRLAASHLELSQSLQAHQGLARIAAHNEAKLAATLSASMDGIITIDASSNIIEINHIASAMFGYQTTHLIGASLADTLIPKAQREAHKNGLTHFLRSGEGPVLRRRLILSGLHAQGHEIPIELTISPVQTEDTLLFTAFIRDIQERQVTEQELNLAARALDANEAIFITDATANIVRINKAFSRITGYSEAEAIGQNPRILSSGRPPQSFYAEMWECIKNHGNWRGEIYNKRKNGDIYPESLSITAVHDNSGAITNYVAHFTDISELKANEESLKKARQQAEEANQAKSRFLATMSHEIRTPLNAIINMNSLLLESELTTEQRQFAQAAVDGGQLLLGLLNNVLDFSKIEAGRLTLDEQWFNPIAMFNAIAELFSGEAQDKGLELVQVTYGAIPSECLADAQRLRQVLTNLIGNAIKFTDEGGITLGLGYHSMEEYHAGRLQLDVFDTGIGIPEDQQAHLFDEFMQADNTDTRRQQGTGLGLSISQRLVRLMGGRIEYYSRPGDGTRFSIEIPVSIKEEADTDLSSQPILPDNAEVLVYSLNPVIRHGLSEQLSHHAIANRSIDDRQALEQALARLDATAATVILLDTPIGTSHSDETDYVKALPQRYPTLRFVRLAPMSEVNAIQASRQAGFRAMVRKPVRTASLLHFIAKGLDQETPPWPSPDTPASQTSTAATPEHANFAKILLVEDSQSNVAIASAALRRDHHEVAVAWNGQEALYAVEDDHFDIILMDISMPEMNGLEATQRIRAGTSPNARTPIIAMTANAFAEDRERCLAAGMDDFMSKPIDIRHLRDTVNNWLRKKPPEPSASPPSAAPDAAAPKPEALIDAGVLDRLAEDTAADIMPELVGIYLEESRKRVRQLLDLHAAGKIEELGKQAHTLKSSSGTFGAHSLQALAQDIEHAAKIADDAKLKAAMRQLAALAERSLNALETALRQWRT